MLPPKQPKRSTSVTSAPARAAAERGRQPTRPRPDDQHLGLVDDLDPARGLADPHGGTIAQGSADMHIAVRLGSGLARLAGRPRLELDLADGATVRDLLDRVAGERPELSAGLPSVLTVVRGSQVASDRVLSDGDEVALLIPISGGSERGARWR